MTTAPDEQPDRVQISSLEYATFILLALSILYQLFADPIVGLASNGDYARITHKVGLYYADPPEDETAHLVRTYESGPSDDWTGYRSSEVVLVRTAMTANRVISKDHQFDITVLGGLHGALYLLGAGIILISVRRFELISRIAVSGLLLLFFSDVAYVSYFNSFYSEPGSLVFLFLTIGLGLLLITRNDSERWRAAYLALFFLAAALFVTAKPQNALLGIPIAIAGYRFWGVPLLPGRQDYLRNIVAGGLGLTLIAVSVVYAVAGQPDGYREANLFNMVFNEILRTSSSPEEDLQELGLDPGMSEYAGLHAYAPGNPREDPGFHSAFYDNIGYGKIAGFYLRHPGRFIDLAERGASQTTVMRPDYLGNFEESAGLPPNTQSQAFATWSNRKPQIVPASLPFLTVFFMGSLGIAAVARWLFRQRHALRLVAELYAGLMVMAGLQFLIVILGEGEYEIVKHLFLYHALFDLSLVFLALLLGSIAMVVWHRYRSQWSLRSDPGQ